MVSLFSKDLTLDQNVVPVICIIVGLNFDHMETKAVQFASSLNIDFPTSMSLSLFNCNNA